MTRRLGAAALVGVLAVGGCGLPHPKDSDVSKVAVTEAEAESVYEHYRDVRRNAFELLDGQPLTAVESGAVLAIDSGALKVARRLLLSETPDDTQDLRILDVYAPRLDSYPMWFIVVVEDGVRDLIKVQVFERQTSTSDWRLAASPETLPTTELPAFEQGNSDVLESVDPEDDAGLAMSPQQALDAYADTLNDPAPTEASGVQEDSFVTQMRDVARQQRTIEGVAFSQQWSARDVEYAVRASDGGALVFGTLSRVDRYEIAEDRYIDWPEGSEQKAFLSGRLYSSGELRYFHQILVYVPPGDGEPLVLGHYGGVVDAIGY